MTKNVPLRNDTAKVKDVCTLLAHMMAISNHADHALFSIVDGKGKILEQLSRSCEICSLHELKVSKFQNEFMKSSFLPKYELIVRISVL